MEVLSFFRIGATGVRQRKNRLAIHRVQRQRGMRWKKKKKRISYRLTFSDNSFLRKLSSWLKRSRPEFFRCSMRNADFQKLQMRWDTWIGLRLSDMSTEISPCFFLLLCYQSLASKLVQQHQRSLNVTSILCCYVLWIQSRVHSFHFWQFEKSRFGNSGFIILHYAGRVEYNTAGFLEKVTRYLSTFWWRHQVVWTFEW